MVTVDECDPSECMVCGSSDISAEEFETSQCFTYRDVECKNCGTIWQETFIFEGYEVTHKGEVNE